MSTHHKVPQAFLPPVQRSKPEEVGGQRVTTHNMLAVAAQHFWGTKMLSRQLTNSTMKRKDVRSTTHRAVYPKDIEFCPTPHKKGKYERRTTDFRPSTEEAIQQTPMPVHPRFLPRFH